MKPPRPSRIILPAAVVVAGAAWMLRRSGGSSSGSSSSWTTKDSSVVVPDGLAAALDVVVAAYWESQPDATEPVMVTSGLRSVPEQVDAMLSHGADDTGVDWAYATYSRSDLVAELAAVWGDRDAMIAVMEDQLDRGEYISVHLTGWAADVRMPHDGAWAGYLDVDAWVAAVEAAGAEALVESDHVHAEHFDRVSGVA